MTVYTLDYSLEFHAVPYDKGIMAAVMPVDNRAGFEGAYGEGYVSIVSDPEFVPTLAFRLVRLLRDNNAMWGEAMPIHVIDQDGFLYEPVGAVRRKECRTNHWTQPVLSTVFKTQVYGAVGNLRHNLARLHEKYYKQIERLNKGDLGGGPSDHHSWRVRLFKQRPGMHIDHVKAMVEAGVEAGLDMNFSSVTDGTLHFDLEIKYPFSSKPNNSDLVTLFAEIRDFKANLEFLSQDIKKRAVERVKECNPNSAPPSSADAKTVAAASS